MTSQSLTLSKLVSSRDFRLLLGSLISTVASAIGVQSCLWYMDTFIWARNTTLYLPFPGLWAFGTSDPGTVLNFTYYEFDGCLIWFGASCVCLGIAIAFYAARMGTTKVPQTMLQGSKRK